jgi:CBS domain-containing protein
MQIELVTAFIVVAVLAAVVALRSATSGRWEITLNDALIAAIAAALVLLVSGNIDKFGVGTSGITVEMTKKAILASADRPITQQVAPLPVIPVEQALKGGVAEIPEMVRHRVQGLDFVLGFGGYDPNALKAYLETLTRYDFFRFVIIQTPDRKLVGMLDARSLLAFLQDPSSGESFQDFAALLNRPSDADRNKLEKFPGFVPAKEAVTPQADKREVLDRMEKSGRSWLPVIGAQGQLEGVVEQSRLTASMIIDVTNQLRAEPAH